MTAKRALILCAVAWLVLLMVTTCIVVAYHIPWWGQLLFTVARVIPVMAFVVIYLGWYRNPRQ